MKRFFAIIFLVKFLLILFVANSYAAKGVASVYKATMRKVELCTGSTSVTSCDGSVTIGSGDKIIDIAAVDAGAVAGSYGDITLLPLGETYTHIRVTIDRKFVIKSATIDTGSSGNTDATPLAAYELATNNTNKNLTKKINAKNLFINLPSKLLIIL